MSFCCGPAENDNQTGCVGGQTIATLHSCKNYLVNYPCQMSEWPVGKDTALVIVIVNELV